MTAQAPAPPKSAICRSCSARIVFVVNDYGNRMCLNAEPDPERGNVSITVDEMGIGVARVFGRDRAVILRAEGKKLYLDHHATCPKLDQWRGRR